MSAVIVELQHVVEEGAHPKFQARQRHHADTIARDSIPYPKWSSSIAASATEETLRTVINPVRHNGDMRDLMITRKTFINRHPAANF